MSQPSWSRLPADTTRDVGAEREGGGDAEDPPAADRPEPLRSRLGNTKNRARSQKGGGDRDRRMLQDDRHGGAKGIPHREAVRPDVETNGFAVAPQGDVTRAIFPRIAGTKSASKAHQVKKTDALGTDRVRVSRSETTAPTMASSSYSMASAERTLSTGQPSPDASRASLKRGALRELPDQRDEHRFVPGGNAAWSTAATAPASTVANRVVFSCSFIGIIRACEPSSLRGRPGA